LPCQGRAQNPPPFRPLNDASRNGSVTDDILDRATIVKDGKIIQRGRPPLGDRAKRTVTIRLDADIVESYRTLGRGWQTRLNADLRRVRKLKKTG